MAYPAGRVWLAFNQDTFKWAPTWTQIDSHAHLVTSYTIDRGRQFELDRTDVGRATISIADPDGILDPTNTAGPYYGWIEPLIQASICRYNPVAAEWQPRFRGFVEELDYSYDPAMKVTRLQMSLVDIFAKLARMEMFPGYWGDDPVAAGAPNSAGNVFFPTANMDDRINKVIGDSGIPADFFVIFSGNVSVWATVYSPASENALTAIQDAADADFPGVSNCFTDRYGRLCVHGRLAKFDPAGTLASTAYTAWSSGTAYLVGDKVSSAGLAYQCVLAHTNHVPPNATYWLPIPLKWNWQHWHAGDGAAVAGAPTTMAHLRRLAYNRGLAKVINAGYATPPEVLYTATELDGQVYRDTSSITTFGWSSWSAQNLITKEGLIDSSTALVETKRFAQFYVDNCAEPRNRITDIAFRTMAPSQVGAAILWRLLSEIDIGDRVDVTAAGSGGTSGFTAEPFFVEGVHEDVRPLNPTYDDVTLSLDLSPQAYFTGSNPFPS